MNRNYQLISLVLLAGLAGHTGRAQTAASNVRLRVDPVVRKVIIEYELAQALPDDSIYIELATKSQGIIRPLSVQGDVGKGVKRGPKKLVTWDVVRDKVRLDEEVTVLLQVARMVPATANTPIDKSTATTGDRTTSPESVIRRKSPLPIIGWAVAGALTGYATVLALGLNKDVKAYNSKPFADNSADLQRYQDQKKSIESRKGTFTIVAGVAAAAVVANVVYFVVRKTKTPRTSLLIQPGHQLTSVGLSRRF